MPVQFEVWLDRPRRVRPVDSYVRKPSKIKCRYESVHVPSVPRKRAAIHAHRHKDHGPFADWITKGEVDLILAQRLAQARPFEDRFLELALRWRNEVRTVSSTTDRVLHSAYQDIIGMGEPVLPLIFREMKKRGGHWFWALRHITQQNPASPEDAGNIQKLTDVWLKWGQERHYL